MMTSSSIHFPENNIISFFFMAAKYSILYIYIYIYAHKEHIHIYNTYVYTCIYRKSYVYTYIP
jgi:hypothetical protein